MPICAVLAAGLLVPRNRNSRTIIKIASLVVLLFAAALTGCGGGTLDSTSSRTTGFDNRTNGAATDPQLRALWQRAQQELATQPIVLNPVAVQMHGGTLVSIAPDSRANSVQPEGVAVIAVPDLTVAQLQAENPRVALQHNTDPTGVIHCPEGALAKYCHSYTASNNQAAYVSTSMVLNFGATGWEFENIILRRLGYDTASR